MRFSKEVVITEPLHPDLIWLPGLWGNGLDGSGTATNNTNVGYLASGPKQYFNWDIPAGVTWTVQKGNSSGALVLAARNFLRIAGTIQAGGANGATATSGVGGAGGDKAGGGAGGAQQTVANTAGNTGSAATLVGHGTGTVGTAPDTTFAIGALGGGGGAYTTASSVIGGRGKENPPSIGRFSDSPPPRVFQNGIFCGAYFQEANVLSYTVAPSFNTAWSADPLGNSSALAVHPNTGIFHPSYLMGGVSGHGGGAVNNTGSGGGGGGGGGVVYLVAPTIELVSGYVIDCSGGNGGNAFAATGGSARGGDAGGGGQCVIICRKLIGGAGGIDITGGTGGALAGPGAVNGGAGIDGKLIIAII